MEPESGRSSNHGLEQNIKHAQAAFAWAQRVSGCAASVGMHSWTLAYANFGLDVLHTTQKSPQTLGFHSPPASPTAISRTAEYSPGTAQGHDHPPASSLPAMEMPHSNLGTSHAQTGLGEAGRAKESTHCLRWARPCVCSSCVTGTGPGAGALAGSQARSGRHLSLLGDLATPACPNA